MLLILRQNSRWEATWGGKGSVLAHSLRGVVSRGEGMATGESVAVGGWTRLGVSCSHLGGSESGGIHFF